MAFRQGRRPVHLDESFRRLRRELVEYERGAAQTGFDVIWH